MLVAAGSCPYSWAFLSSSSLWVASPGWRECEAQVGPSAGGGLHLWVCRWTADGNTHYLPPPPRTLSHSFYRSIIFSHALSSTVTLSFPLNYTFYFHSAILLRITFLRCEFTSTLFIFCRWQSVVATNFGYFLIPRHYNNCLFFYDCTSECSVSIAILSYRPE